MNRGLVTCMTSQAWRRVLPGYAPTRNMSDMTSSGDVRVKPWSEVPRARALPIIGDIVNQVRGGVIGGGMHKYYAKRAKELGPIFKEKMGPNEGLWINDPETIKDFFRREPKHPQRYQFDAWRMHREESGRGYGIFLLDDEDWQTHRTALNQHMMRPRNVAAHLGDFKHVTEEFLGLLERDFPAGKTIENMREKLFYWSLEAALTVLFERRFGCLSDARDPKIDRFVTAFRDLLTTAEKLIVFPPKIAKSLNSSVWRKHYDGWETTFDIAGEYITPLIEEAKAKLERGEDVVGVTASMVKAGNISDKEILASIMTLMGAAIDTTSNTVNWLLLLLAQNPAKQEKLRSEIKNVVPSSEVLDINHLNQLHYLKATLRETLRLYPTAPQFTRMLKEEMVIGGYSVPKDTIVVLNIIANRDNPDIYKEPGEFRPERWLRGDEGDDVNPHANLPFGHGVRMCIGRRVAELEIHTLIAMLLLKKKVELAYPNTVVGDKQVLLLTPDKEVAFKLIDL